MYEHTMYEIIHDCYIGIAEHYILSNDFINTYGNAEAIEIIKAGVIDAIDAFAEDTIQELRTTEQNTLYTSGNFSIVLSAVSEFCNSYKDVDLQPYIRMYHADDSTDDYADGYTKQAFSNNMSGYIAQAVIRQIFVKLITDVLPYSYNKMLSSKN